MSLLPIEELAGKTVYLAGPMRGKPNYNFGEFLAVGSLLSAAGINVYNPAKVDLAKGLRPSEPLDSDHNQLHFDLHDTFMMDVRQVLMRDAIILLPGWVGSNGAKVEYCVAKMTGKRVYEIHSYQPGAPESIQLIRLEYAMVLEIETGA